MGGGEDDDDIREFRKLQKQYAKATTEERDRLLPDFTRAIEKVSPGLLETADTRFFNGDYLKDMFDQCMKRALARPDLTPDRKTNAKEDAANFIMFFNATKLWPLPKLAAHAFEMATLALFTGLRAGLSPDEIAKLESDKQSARAKNPRKKKPRFWYARMLALKIPEKDRLLSNEKIAVKLLDDWAKEKPAEWAKEKPAKCAEEKPPRPSFDWLTGFVGELRADGTYPHRPTRTRRPRARRPRD